MRAWQLTDMPVHCVQFFNIWVEPLVEVAVKLVGEQVVIEVRTVAAGACCWPVVGTALSLCYSPVIAPGCC